MIFLSNLRTQGKTMALSTDYYRGMYEQEIYEREMRRKYKDHWIGTDWHQDFNTHAKVKVPTQHNKTKLLLRRK